MGAGGMIFVDPLFQRVLVDTVRSFEPWSSNHRTGTGWSGLPVIFDEVFVGLYRLGVESTTSLLGVCPDISVNAKILTGGLVPLSTTLTTESIFRAFYSDSKADALLHGHSYTAYPIGCEVANETLDIVTRMADGDAWKDAQALWDREDDVPRKVWSFWDPRFVDAVSKCKAAGEVMTLGTVLALKVAGDAQGVFPCVCFHRSADHGVRRLSVPLRAKASGRFAEGCQRRRHLGRCHAVRHQLSHVGQRRILYAQPQHPGLYGAAHRKQDMARDGLRVEDLNGHASSSASLQCITYRRYIGYNIRTTIRRRRHKLPVGGANCP